MKPRTYLFIEVIKAIIGLFKKDKDKDWWKENYKNTYD